MTTATFSQPNYTSDLGTSYPLKIDASIQAMSRVGRAFAAHEQDNGSPAPDLTVRVDAGGLLSGTTLTEVAAQTVSGFTIPSAGQNRVDRVVLDVVTGVATRVAGTAVTGSPTATAPAIPSGKIPLCQVLISSTDTAITNAMITDERAPPILQMPAAASTSLIWGMTYQPTTTSPNTNGIDFAAGGAMDATGAKYMALSAITKFSDTNWAVGTGNGALDTGAVGNSDYYIHLIMRSDTGVVDLLFSLSSTAPTMPANYDYKRLIGWFKRVGGVIVAFHTYEMEGGGLEFRWDAPTLDVNLANTLTTSRRTDAAKVPLNFSVTADMSIVITDASSNSHNWLGCPDQTDVAPSGTAALLANNNSPAGGFNNDREMFIRTSAAGLIAARSTLATCDLYCASTMGFTWSRRP